jgi:hypothetical protein
MGKKTPKRMQRVNTLMYWDKNEMCSIALKIDDLGYVQDVEFRRYGSPQEEIPFTLASESLAELGFIMNSTATKYCENQSAGCYGS